MLGTEAFDGRSWSAARLRRAVNALEEAELEREAAVAEAVHSGCPIGMVAEEASLSPTEVHRIARAWGVVASK